eukprot:817559-Ditylum_brightwellii.AAC.1
MGLGLAYLKGVHLAMQVEPIIKHIQNNDEIWEAALIMFQWAQHTAGDGLNTINGTIELKDDWIWPWQQANDRQIMQVMMHSPAVNTKDLLAINYC